MIVKVSECNLSFGKVAELEIMSHPIECEQCSAAISGDVALSFEGADYIHHYCGSGCLDAWCRWMKVRKK